MRQIYVYDPLSERMIPKEEMLARKANQQMPQTYACPMVMKDSMAPVQSMLDGKMYDSKAALRATYKAAGVTEVGNDSSILKPKPFQKPRPKREEIRASVEKAVSYVNLTS